MLNIPEEIKDLFRADNISKETQRHLKLRFYDENIILLFPEDTLFPSDVLFPVNQEPCYVIDNNQIVTESLIITESLCDSESLIFGECNATQLEITVADVLIDLTGKEFMATVEVGDYEMSLGIYRVFSFVRQADRRKKKITAYNRMMNFQANVAEWYQGLTFPMKLQEFRNSLCAYVGIKQIDTILPLDDLLITKTINPEQLSGLEVLQAICEINGCFGQVDNTGRLKYVFLSMSGVFPSEELFPNDDLFPSNLSDGETERLSYYKQSETSYEDYVVTPIDRLQIRQEEGDIGILYGPGSNCYVIQGNFLAYGKSSNELFQIAANVYNQIAGRTYRPCRITGPALPWVEVGDGLICYTTDDVIETYCLKRCIKGIQAMMDTYEAAGNIEREENFGIQTQIIQLEGKAAVIKKSVEEVSVRVTDLKNYTESQFKITSEAIEAEVTRAKGEEDKLSSKITIEAGRITEEVIARENADTELSSKITQTAESITLEVNKKVSKGEVTDNLNSELKITGNTIALTTGHFTINAKNMTVDSQGNATFSGKISGASFQGGTISIGDGIFEVDESGKVTAKNITIDGVANQSTIGCSVLSAITASLSTIQDCQTGHINELNVNSIWCGGNVECKEIYPSGSWWKGWGLTETMSWLDERITALGG